MALIASVQNLVQANGTSSTFTVGNSLDVPETLDPFTITTNTPFLSATLGTDGVTVTVTNTATFPISGLVSVTDSLLNACYVPVLTYTPITTVQTGRSAAQAVATVRRRTNLNFGEPADLDIVAMLNDGIEAVSADIEPVVAMQSLLVVAPNTNMLALPLDFERVRDANFSTGNPAVGGTVVYELVQLDYDSFIQETDASPAGGIGGIPTIYSLVQDSSGIMLVQFYPFANAGQFNFHYYKRPAIYVVGPGNVASATSFTDLDSLWQEAVILYACSQACENREDYGTADRFFKMFEAAMEKNSLKVKRRTRKRGTNTVRDVTANESVIAPWMR
jgi:hypothetical protein